MTTKQSSTTRIPQQMGFIPNALLIMCCKLEKLVFDDDSTTFDEDEYSYALSASSEEEVAEWVDFKSMHNDSASLSSISDSDDDDELEDEEYYASDHAMATVNISFDKNKLLRETSNVTSATIDLYHDDESSCCSGDSFAF